MADPPEVTIVLLGDAEVGKSMLLSYEPPLYRIKAAVTDISNHDSRLSQPHANDGKSLPLLRDLDQPFVYDVRLFNRPYRFEFSDTASPRNYTLLQPDVVLLCYDISNPSSLKSVKERWSKEVHMYYETDRPTLLLGLKRDLRTEKMISPLDAYCVAQELRCDRYLECSALTGELVREVFEDISRTAAMSTTERGGQSDGGCGVM
ncbi:MAG: hypothetical protein M1840_007741 [Geoglossum simile]|nr:MAG: hypothetical protein M1840_007741 [Geoglossum simile]